ncbi:hypothetical protein D910_05537 [Dendroctonus ponderosae]|uniref:MBD domain-containing protein n=1 Tax=Dendroctonus ponderosae TaxID=77166 RepID=U4U2N3_DENPD|nr:hypothetical protein D910_05537 [Dendroctonus ponderosae]
MEDPKQTDELVTPETAEVSPEDEKVAEKEATEKDADKMDPNPETVATENGNSLLQTSTESATSLDASMENDALFETSAESAALLETDTKNDATNETTTEQTALLETNIESATPEVTPAAEITEEPAKAPEPPGEPVEKVQEQEKVVRATRSTKRKVNEIDCNDNSKDAPSHETSEQKENVVSKKNENTQNSNTQTQEISSHDPLSSTEVMGKGKRARIPNKRVLQFGDWLQDPKYFKPFKFGWRRELVWKSTPTDTRKKGSIYYYTPTGKKVRTFRELSDHLTGKNLTLDNFSFSKELLGIDDPLKELSRESNCDKSDSGSGSESPPPPSKKSKKVVSPKSYDSDTSKSDAKSSTSNRRRAAISILNQTSEQSEPEAETSTRKAGKMSLRKGRAPPAKKARLAKNEEANEIETSASAVRSSPRKTSKPCSIGCEGVQDIIPTLQCRICLCLYHHECVGLNPSITYPYVCKVSTLQASLLNCEDGVQAVNGSSTAKVLPPPLLSPIKDPKSISSSAGKSLPKLQRISRLESADPIQSAPLDEGRNGLGERTGMEVPHNLQQSPDATAKCQSLVGAVTSWLPHNVKIVDNPEATEAPRPQYVEYLAGRKFLVIPKHNFMSVSGSSTSRAPDTVQPTEVPVSSGHNTSERVLSVSKNTSAGVNEEVYEVKDEPLSPLKPPEEEVIQTAAAECNGEENIRQDTQESSKEKANVDNDEYAFAIENGGERCVCSMWRDIAGSPMLWRTIRMKNSQVHSFVGLANALKKHGTVHLDLRKMLLPSTGDDIWPEFSKAITGVDTLRKIELCRCPASVVEELTKSNPHLEVINAVTIKCESLNLDSFNALKCVKELRLKSTCGLSIKSIDSLRELKTLKILSLTSVTDLHKLDLSVLAELVNLEWLDLGECTDFPKNFGSDILLKLNRLEKLRLEKGQGSCHTFEILEAVKDMERLEQLELVNFDVKTGFDKAIGLCTNIKKLMIIPTYISQSATTNNMVLSGVLQLHESLSHFVWGVTLELLRVTELFVDQCEDSNKKEKKPGGNGDCIPVLKPVPDISNGRSIQAASNPPQVEILPLPNLQKLLLNSLPTTRVKILKIPFHATWRQTLSDTV